MRRRLKDIGATATLLAGCVLVAGCSATGLMNDVRSAADGDRLTVGKVQKEIRVGMSSADVVAQLGSPNIVATDSQGREVWTYDRFATESVRKSTGGGVGLLLLGYGTSAAGASTSQRTLTVIVKYGHDGLVRDISYHTSQF